MILRHLKQLRLLVVEVVEGCLSCLLVAIKGATVNNVDGDNAAIVVDGCDLQDRCRGSVLEGEREEGKGGRRR